MLSRHFKVASSYFDWKVRHFFFGLSHQCAGCLKYHKLVDNLGLVVEYDLRDDMDTDADEV